MTRGFGSTLPKGCVVIRLHTLTVGILRALRLSATPRVGRTYVVNTGVEDYLVTLIKDDKI